MDSITAALKQFIENNIISNEVSIDEHTSLQSIGVDSFSIVEIILFIERKFGLLLPDEKLVPETFASLDSLTQVIKALL